MASRYSILHLLRPYLDNVSGWPGYNDMQPHWAHGIMGNPMNNYSVLSFDFRGNNGLLHCPLTTTDNEKKIQHKYLNGISIKSIKSFVQ